MDWDELIASLDKDINEIKDKAGFDTFSSDDSSKENNKLNPEEELERKLNEIISKYQSTKNVSLLTEFLDLIEDISYPKLKQYLMLQFDDGKTILETISKQGVNLDYSLNVEILKDPDLVRILIQSKNKEAFTFAGEKDLLLEVDGMPVVEHLIKEKIFEKYWISKISKSPIIIDILVKYDKKKYLIYLSEEQLFMPFEDGTVLDYLFKNDLFGSSTISNIRTNPEIYNYIVKYKRYDKFEDLSESLLTEKIGEKYILDLILEQNRKPCIYGLRNQKLLSLIIEKNRLDLLEGVSSSALTTIVPGEEVMLFEYLLDRGIIPTEGIKSITGGYDTGDKLFKIIESKNRYDLLTQISEARLLQTHGYKTLFEILMENNVPVELKSVSKKETIDLVYNSGKFELFQACKENLLMTVLPNGKTILQELVERKLFDLKVNIENDQALEYIFDNSIYQLYTRVTTKGLLKHKDLNTTYLDQVLEESKTNPEINITRLVDDAQWDAYENAQSRIIYAKHDMHMYLSRLTEEDLLKEVNDVRLIDALLEIDPIIAVQKIIPAHEREKIEIAMIIKLKGIEQQEIHFDSITEKIEDEYLNGRRKEYETIKLSPEQEQLLNSLSQAYNDGLGDPILIATLIANYRYLLSVGSIHTEDIQHLIEIKHQHPQFTYKTIKDGAYFSSHKNSISMDDSNMDTLNHETGHALFHYLTDKKLPEGFEELIARLRENPEFLEKLSQYSKQFYELKEKVELDVEATFMKKYDESITEEKRKEIEAFLNKLNYEERAKYIKLGYAPEVLDVILSKMYTVDEYIEQDRRIKKQTMVDLILRTQHGPFIALGDFYDGIFKGKFKGGVLVDARGEKIRPAYGHGIEYYSRDTGWIFDEMMANYSGISKSQFSELGLQQLQEYIGEELFNMLTEYYQKEILQSTKLSYAQQVAL